MARTRRLRRALRELHPLALFTSEAIIVLILTVLVYLVAMFVGWKAYLLPVFDGLLAAFVLTLIVDPFLKNRFADKVGREMFWVLTNEHAPISQRNLVERLANTRVFYEHSEWSIRVEWDDRENGVIRLEIDVENTCINHDIAGYRPSNYAYVLASTHGYKSDYVTFRVASTDGRQRHLYIHLGEHTDPPIERYVDRDKYTDGSILLDEPRIMTDLADGRSVGPGQGFILARGVRIHRRSRGFFPMIGRTAADEHCFTISGGAARDLAFSIMVTPTGESHDITPGKRFALEIGDLPMTILSWRPVLEECVTPPSDASTVRATPVSS